MGAWLANDHFSLMRTPDHAVSGESMSRHYEGGCHCGAVRYTCNKEPELTFYCHCKDCQKTTGSPSPSN